MILEKQFVHLQKDEIGLPILCHTKKISLKQIENSNTRLETVKLVENLEGNFMMLVTMMIS